MSAAVHKITSSNPQREERDRLIGTAAREWECDICELADMAGVVSAIVERSTGSNGELAAFPDLNVMTSEQVSQVRFVAYHLEKMIGAFKDKYYSLIEA